jgi:tetratricopeptide (TPR) repeat protein
MTASSERDSPSVLAMAADDRSLEQPMAGRSQAGAPDARGGKGRRTLRRAPWIALLGLVVLNAWWWWRGGRPVPDLKSIELLISQKHQAEAEQALGQRLAYSPHDGDSHALLAKLFGQRGDMRACALELRQIPFWWPAKGKYLLMEGTAFKQMDRMRDAESAWQAIVKDDPLHPVERKYVTAAVMDLLELYAIEGRWSDAARLIWTDYDRLDDPHDREALLVMRMRTELERITPAVAAEKLRRFLAADPEDWAAERALAKVEVALNNGDEAKKLLEGCLEHQPQDPRGWTDELAVLSELGDLEALRDTLARVPPTIAGDPSFFRFHAVLAERDRNWDEAARLYERLTQIRPWERENFYRLALVETRLGRAAKAQEHRKRSEAMQAARVELNDAFQKVLDVRRLESPSSEVKSAIDRLVQVCRVLSWTRDAEAWERLSPPST